MELHEKLVQIQSELKAPKNQRNKFGNYNYRSAEDILEALKPHLKAHGLSLTIDDEVDYVSCTKSSETSYFDYEKEPIQSKSDKQDGVIYIVATVTLSDGENQVSTKAMAGIDPQKKGMDISQTFGAASSYARKYALNGMFMIDDTKDADATNDHGKGKAKKSPSNPQKPPTLPADRFKKAVEAYNVGDEEIKKKIVGNLTSDFTLTEGQVKEFYNQTKCKL